MNETERAALVDFVRGELWRMNASDMMDDDVHVSIANHIIDRLLAAAAAPEVGLDIDLDKMLHPVGNAPLDLHQFEEGGDWTARIDTVHGPVGTGLTRMEALRNAVAQATATTQEGASE